MNDVQTTDHRTAALATLEDAPLDLFTGATGLESADADCYIIPFLKIAQASTEEAKRGSTSFLKGLDPGMFFSPSTRRIYGERMRLVVLKFYRTYVIYEGEDTKSKFLGTMDADTFRREVEPHTRRVKSYAVDQNGHRYVDTRNFIVLSYDNPMDGPMLLSLSSTGINPSRKLLTQAQNIKVRNREGRVVVAPTWWSVWELGLGYFDNPNGGYYQINSIDHLGGVPNDIATIFRGAFDEIQAQATPEMAPADVTEDRDVTPRQAPAPQPAAAPGFKPGMGNAGTQAQTVPRSDDEEELF